jgi:hypothetical protein
MPRVSNYTATMAEGMCDRKQLWEWPLKYTDITTRLLGMMRSLWYFWLFSQRDGTST